MSSPRMQRIGKVLLVVFALACVLATVAFAEGDAVLPENLLGHGAGKYQRCRQSSGKVAAAAVVIMAAVAHMTSIVGMARPRQGEQVLIVC